MSEYKVTSVMIDPPKEWRGPHGSVWYKSVMVEGHDKPISVGKKDPETLKAGVVIYGDIIPTDYLTDKFKATPPPQSSDGSGGFKKSEGSQYLKDLSDLPLRVFTSSVGLFDTQALVKGGQYYTNFITFVQNVSNDLLLMAENVRNGEIKAEAKKEPLPFGEPFTGDPNDIPFD